MIQQLSFRHLAVMVVLFASQIFCRPARAENSLDLAQYRGEVVVLDFWASWCKPCRQSIPWLNEMHSRYGAKGLRIIGVNVDAERGDAEKFLRETPIQFSVLFDPKGELATRYSLQGMPTTLIFDRDGKQVATHLGFQASKKAAREAGLKTLLEKEHK